MSSPPANPALRARYDRRRAQVVAAAARVFAERGYHATSMQDLIEATGLTAGGLYHYISGKDALLVAICDELMEPLLEQAHEIVAEPAPADVHLRELVRAWVAHVERSRDHMLVFMQERHVLERDPRWRHVRRQRKEFEELLADVLERGEREGVLRFADRGLALRALLGMVNHTPQWYRPNGRLNVSEIADGYLDLLCASSC
ncbi:MAG TPA: TetR/AcrR family transcriptional regulator [Solirubrobacteraceae bacterium]|jgi:AcrR family transcriptional regulator|nr:TetR/AcrR family transcriptional regulator [Solirubrobacteraceae bacterium]